MAKHPVIGTIEFPFDGEVELPDFPGNGGPAPEETYHWFRDGTDLSILVGGQKLNGKLLGAQAWYRGGSFEGWIKLAKSSPEAGKPIMVFPRGDHIPFKNGGLAGVGQAFGTGWYSNGDNKDAQPILVQWLKFALQFMAPDPKDSGKLSRVKDKYPSDWGNYGLFLTWKIGVP